MLCVLRRTAALTASQQPDADSARVQGIAAPAAVLLSTLLVVTASVALLAGASVLAAVIKCKLTVSTVSVIELPAVVTACSIHDVQSTHFTQCGPQIAAEMIQFKQPLQMYSVRYMAKWCLAAHHLVLHQGVHCHGSLQRPNRCQLLSSCVVLASSVCFTRQQAQ
eukprot:13187-Heterococcus_DN1.PRE.2